MKVQAKGRGAEDEAAYTRLWEGLDLPRLESLLPERNPRPSRNGRYLIITCPQCGHREAWLYPAKEGKRPHLHCNRKNQCGWEQSLWDYFLERNRGDKRATFRELAQAAGVPVEDSPASGPQVHRRKLLKPLLPPVSKANKIAPDASRLERQAQYRQAFIGSPAAAYAASRGVSPERAEAAGLGYAQSWLGWGGERLTYPLQDETGQLVGIEGRELAVKKYLFDGQKGAGVFWAGPERSFEGLHLVEGPFDALALREIGVNAVAVCGTACPEWFLKRLAFRKVWLAFDADAAGDKADTYAAELAQYGTTAYRLRPPEEGRDWGDYLQAGGKEAVREAYLRAGGKLPEAMGKSLPADACRFCGAEVERYSADGLLSCGACSDREPEAAELVATVAAVRQRLAGPGWAAIESGTLGETVLFVRDRGAEVPDRWQKAVRYTLDELGELRGKDPEGLKLVHEVKRVMGGEIVPEEGFSREPGKGRQNRLVGAGRAIL